MDLLVAGRDIVAVDAVCTAIMGFNPGSVRHLALAAEKGIGEAALSRITIKGVPIEEVRRPFRHACWEAEVRIEKTDALVGKLAQLADRVHKYRDEDTNALFLSFSPGHLKVDKAKYPNREPQGFRVEVPVAGDKITFIVPFRILFLEEGQAAVDEVGGWIEDHLGKGIPMVKVPFRPAP
jgi:hypothetical protein